MLNQTDEFSPIFTRPIRLALGAMKDVSLISGMELSKVYNVKAVQKLNFKLISANHFTIRKIINAVTLLKPVFLLALTGSVSTGVPDS